VDFDAERTAASLGTRVREAGEAVDEVTEKVRRRYEEANVPSLNGPRLTRSDTAIAHAVACAVFNFGADAGVGIAPPYPARLMGPGVVAPGPLTFTLRLPIEEVL
jgi:hypothetical protein